MKENKCVQTFDIGVLLGKRYREPNVFITDIQA